MLHSITIEAYIIVKYKINRAHDNAINRRMSAFLLVGFSDRPAGGVVDFDFDLDFDLGFDLAFLPPQQHNAMARQASHFR
jgi:hypothetical protein